MWPENSRRDGSDNLKREVNALIEYLSHCNKSKYVATLMELVRSNESLAASLNHAVSNSRRDEHQDQRYAEYGRQTIELPIGVREVNLTF